MSNVNVKEELINFSKMVKKYDLNNIITEGPENCQHNNSKIYYQGIVDLKKTKYFTICYQNPICKSNIKNLFELSNMNKNRTKNSIATMGLGIKLIFHKLGKRINVVSISDNINYTRLNLEKHMKEVIVSENDRLEVLHAKNCISETIDSWEDFEDDNGKIATIVRKIQTNFKEVNVEIPKSFIIIEVNKNMEEECIKSQQECGRIFGTKFNYNNSFDMYLFDLDITNDKFTINMVKKRDILGLNNKEDSATFYVKYIEREKRKHMNDHCIVYLKENKKRIYYKRILNGTGKKCTWKPITTPYLKSKCKDLDSYDFSVNFYRITESYFNKITDNITTNDIGYTGVYLMTRKDQNLLNFKPNSWYNYCKQPVGRHDYWSERARLVISINNKDYFDIRGIKIETKPTIESARLIQDCFEIFKQTKSYKMGTKRAAQGGGKNYKALYKTIPVKEFKNIFINKKSKTGGSSTGGSSTGGSTTGGSSTGDGTKDTSDNMGYIYAITDKTRPTYIKLGKTSFNFKLAQVRKEKGYCTRHYPFGTECIKCIRVSNRHVAEKQLFEKCKSERIGESEWYIKENIENSINNGLFESIAKSLQPIKSSNN